MDLVSQAFNATLYRDYARAVTLWTFAAAQGDLEAKRILAYWHQTGIALPKNCDMAAKWYLQVADAVVDQLLQVPLGRSIVSFKRWYGASLYGLEKKTSQTLPNVLNFYESHADNGDYPAQLLLGQVYYYGHGDIQPNHSKALVYLQRVARLYPAFQSSDTTDKKEKLQIVSEAAAILGMMYWRGEGVTADELAARKWFELGAKHNNTLAITGLGHMHLNGLGGLSVDRKLARKLIIRGAQAGNGYAQVTAGDIILADDSDYASAIAYYNLAVQSGNMLALYRLGEMYANGIGVTKSCSDAVSLLKKFIDKAHWMYPKMLEAETFYKQANYTAALESYLLPAEQGMEVAQANVGWMIDEQMYSFKNSTLFPKGTLRYDTALIYWHRAAMQGNTEARIKVGDYYFYGLITNISSIPPKKMPDYERAAQNYEVAAHLEQNPLALYNLAYMHERGMGVPKDFHLAKRLYDQSLSANPDGYLAIYFSLCRLWLSSSWNQLSSGKSTVNEPVTREQNIAELYPEFPIDLIPPEDNDSDWLQIPDWLGLDESEQMFNLLESLMILILFAVGAYLAWWRHRLVTIEDQRRRREEAQRRQMEREPEPIAGPSISNSPQIDQPKHE